jgi:hypothetical protein
MGTLAVTVLAVRPFLRHDLAAVDEIFGAFERRFRRAGARECSRAWHGLIRTPSLEVVNCARTQLSGVTASNRRRTSDVFTPRAPSSTAAGSGGWSARIWASSCWAVTWSFRRLGFDAS